MINVKPARVALGQLCIIKKTETMNASKKSRLALETQIHIQATPQQVWAILTDFEKYPEWNPFVKTFKGNPQVGERVEVRLQPQNGRAMVFKPVVLEYDKNRSLTWLGTLWAKGLFDGEHAFRLQPNADGTTTLHQTEHFNGILVPLFKKNLETNTKKDFERLNAALKKRVEESF